MHIYPWQIDPHSHLSMVGLEYCYTKLGRCPPSQSSIDALNTATPNLADLYRYKTMDIYL